MRILESGAVTSVAVGEVTLTRTLGKKIEVVFIVVLLADFPLLVVIGRGGNLSVV